jgi:flagellar hook-length control protein FliK
MIRLQAPISPTPAANAARGDVKGAETAGVAETTPGPDFAALMAGMLSVSSNPGAAATTGANPPDANTADADADTEHDEQDQPAIAIALPAPAPVNAVATADFSAPIRAQGSAPELVGVDLSRSNAAPARADAEAPRTRSAIAEFHAPPRHAAPAAAEEPKAMALPPDGSAHGSMRAPELPLAPDTAQAARQPELQAPQQASRAAEMPVAANSPRIDAPLGSARWREDLAGHITVLVRNAISEAEIRVTPPELGPIQARISVDNGIVTVTLGAPAPETRDALEAALTTLRERLAESGLALGEASVSGDRAQRFEDRAGRDAPGGERAENPSAAPLPADPVRRLRLDGLIDLYA